MQQKWSVWYRAGGVLLALSVIFSGEVAQAQPATPPATFVIYFPKQDSVIPPDAEPTLAQAAAAIAAARARGPYSHVKVIGYSDTTGSRRSAQQRSEARAAAVQTALVHAGVPRREIKIEGRGKRDLEVPTANHVDQPRNRRVRIIVYRPGD